MRSVALRLSPGPLAALVVLVADAVTLAWGWRPRRGDPVWLIDTLGATVWGLLPVLALLSAAVVYLQLPAGRFDHLQGADTVRHRCSSLALLLLPPVVVHGLASCVAVGISAVHGAPQSSDALMMSSTQVLAVGMSVALGAVIGGGTRHPMVIVAAGFVGLVLMTAGSGVLRLSYGDSPFVGLRPEAPWWSWGLVLGASVLLALGYVMPRVWRLLAVAAVVVLLVGGSILLPPAALTPSAPAPAAQCDGAIDVEVCLLPGYSFMADGTRFAVDALVGVAKRNEIELPVSRVEQRIPGAGPTDRGQGALYFDESSLADGVLSFSSAAEVLTRPSWCPQLYDPARPPSGSDASDLTAWLLWRSGKLSTDEARAAIPHVVSLDPSAQGAAMRAAAARLARCEGL